jgi:hypothetical protein
LHHGVVARRGCELPGQVSSGHRLDRLLDRLLDDVRGEPRLGNLISARSARVASITDISDSCDVKSAARAIVNPAAQSPAIANCARRPSAMSPS